MSSLIISTAILSPTPNPNPIHLPLRRTPPSLLHLRRRTTTQTLRLSAALSPPPTLSSSTRTLTTLAALLLNSSKSLFTLISTAAAKTLAPSSFAVAGPLFFARIGDRGSVGGSNLNTPLTLVAAGMARWLDIYSGVLLVRVLLSWFPNIPWDRQPLSAIRDLCDPFLNLFRNIIPPVFDTLDVSPLLAFAVLGVLATILNSSRGL